MDADAFKGLRNRLGVSQRLLAEMLDVNPVTVNRWEHGGKISRVVELAMWGLIYMKQGRDDARQPPPAAPGPVDGGE